MKYNILHSDKQKYVYYRTPKCGSTSIVKYLTAHTEISTAGNSISFNSAWENYFKFAIVRNPWDRLLSAWQDKVRKQWNEKYRFPQFRIKYFEQFHDKDFSFFVNNFKTDEDIHLHSQHTQICTDHIDFIGRFENAREDFKTICNKIGRPNAYLAHENKSKHRNYIDYYDDETRETVAKQYAKDIECFGYTFG